MTKLNPASLTSSTDLSVTAQTEILELYLKKVVLAGNVLPPNTVSTVRLDALGGGDFAVSLETVVATGSWVSFSLFCSNTGLTDHVLTKGIFFPSGDKDIQIAEWNTGFEELNVFIQLAKARLEELNFLPVTPAPKWTDVITNARDALKRFVAERVTLTLRKEESGFFQFPLNEFILDVVGNYEGFEFKLKHEKKILLEGTSAQGKSYAFKRVDTDIEGIDLLLTLFTGLMERDLKEEPEDPYKNKGITQQAEVAVKRLITDIVIPAIRDKARGGFVIPVGNFDIEIEGGFECFLFEVLCSGRKLLSGTYDKESGTGFGINVDVDDLHLLQFVHHLEGLFERQDKLNQQPASTPDQTEPPLIKNVDLNDDWVEYYHSLNPGTSYAAVVVEGLCRINMEIEIAKAVLVKHPLKN